LGSRSKTPLWINAKHSLKQQAKEGIELQTIGPTPFHRLRIQQASWFFSAQQHHRCNSHAVQVHPGGRGLLCLGNATIAITVFAFCTYVPIYGILVLTQVLPSHLAQADSQFVLFQMVYQGIGTVAISGITFTTMIRYYGPVRSTMITALVPGLSALAAALLVQWLMKKLHPVPLVVLSVDEIPTLWASVVQSSWCPSNQEKLSTMTN
jgi:hypothetical protein